MFPSSPSMAPGPVISKEIMISSPLFTNGMFQARCVPSSPSSLVISQSSRLSPFPRISQSLISKFSGMTSLSVTSFSPVSPSLLNIIKTSCRPFPPIFCVILPAPNFLRLWMMLTEGASVASRVQTGPYRSALNSVRAGALTVRPSCSVGPGATNS